MKRTRRGKKAGPAKKLLNEAGLKSTMSQKSRSSKESGKGKSVDFSPETLARMFKLKKDNPALFQELFAEESVE